MKRPHLNDVPHLKCSQSQADLAVAFVVLGAAAAGVWLASMLIEIFS